MLCLIPEAEHRDFSNINGNWQLHSDYQAAGSGELDTGPLLVAHDGGRVPGTRGVTINEALITAQLAGPSACLQAEVKMQVLPTAPEPRAQDLKQVPVGHSKQFPMSLCRLKHLCPSLAWSAHRQGLRLEWGSNAGSVSFEQERVLPIAGLENTPRARDPSACCTE